jgi:hypothetical protein
VGKNAGKRFFTVAKLVVSVNSPLQYGWRHSAIFLFIFQRVSWILGGGVQIRAHRVWRSLKLAGMLGFKGKCGCHRCRMWFGGSREDQIKISHQNQWLILFICERPDQALLRGVGETLLSRRINFTPELRELRPHVPPSETSALPYFVRSDIDKSIA